MLKVMLVDDEPIEREGLKLMLSRNRSNFEITAEAENGKDAVELAIAHKPDLVFMDIKMPELDGIEAIKRIYASAPMIKYIMVSAFDTFDYAREAMKFGIKEYLLKPSKVSEVLAAFDGMAAEIEKEKREARNRQEIHHRLERVSSVIENEFIVSLIMDYVHEFNQEEWDEWLDLEQKKGFVTVFSFESEDQHPSKAVKGHWYRILKQALQAYDLPCIVGPLTGFQVPILVLLDENIPPDKEGRDYFARKIIHDVQKQLEQCLLYAGVGTIVSNIHQFSDSYKEAIYALELVHSHPSAAYMTYNDRVKQKQKQLIPFDVEKELLDAVKKGESQKGLQMFETYFQSIQQASDFQLRMIHKAMESFFIILTRSLKELGFEEEIETSLGQFDHSMQIKEAAKSQLLIIMKRLGEWRSKGIRSLLLEAKEYIDKYYDRAISLEEVADQIGISSYYLSKLFKERFQVTFIDYITNTRLEKAKELLLVPNVSLKEIALTIGYKDPNYFSRVFKKEVGMSPSEYRTKYQQ
ncbi:response regulator [Niallia circulans]|uniref:response regulator n=1 Tax=Niallia circulans TaxID=1397 RepID=UPI00148FE5C6|nr:response regulator [Niallia circulans]QJX61114.1 response regulator [Niallia circulans]